MWDGLDAAVRLDWGDGFEDFPIADGSATVEVPEGVSRVEMGVVSGRLATTNRAGAKVLPSVLDLTRGMAEGDPAWPQEES